MVMATMESK